VINSLAAFLAASVGGAQRLHSKVRQYRSSYSRAGEALVDAVGWMLAHASAAAEACSHGLLTSKTPGINQLLTLSAWRRNQVAIGD